ncbi:MAG: ABC transporter permease subunit, partial [Planctomycetota bacterium]
MNVTGTGRSAKRARLLVWIFGGIALIDLLFGGLLRWKFVIFWPNVDLDKDPIRFSWLRFDLPLLMMVGFIGAVACWVWWRRKAGDTRQQIFLVLSRPLALVIVFLFFLTFVPDGVFAKSRNLENILRQSAVYATAALGMTMVIIAAGIDLSIGSIIALTVVMVASVLNLHQEVPVPGGG